MFLFADRLADRLQCALVCVHCPECRRSLDSGHHGGVRPGRQMGAAEAAGKGRIAGGGVESDGGRGGWRVWRS